MRIGWQKSLRRGDEAVCMDRLSRRRFIVRRVRSGKPVRCQRTGSQKRAGALWLRWAAQAHLFEDGNLYWQGPIGWTP